jgi:hypothetical protein
MKGLCRLPLVAAGTAAAALGWGEYEHRRLSHRRVNADAAETPGSEAVVVLGFRNRGDHANAVNRWRARAGLRSQQLHLGPSRLVLGELRDYDRGADRGMSSIGLLQAWVGARSAEVGQVREAVRGGQLLGCAPAGASDHREVPATHGGADASGEQAGRGSRSSHDTDELGPAGMAVESPSIAANC